MPFYVPLTLLFSANIFMTFAWYAHLKNYKNMPLWWVILLSWGIAFFEYCLQVPANRFASEQFTLPQLKIIQEIFTLIVFFVFSTWYMQVPFKFDYVLSAFCMLGAVYFMFR